MIRVAITSALVLAGIYVVTEVWPVNPVQALPGPGNLISTIKEVFGGQGEKVAARVQQTIKSDIAKRIALGTVLGVGLAEVVLS